MCNAELVLECNNHKAGYQNRRDMYDSPVTYSKSTIGYSGGGYK